MIIKKWGGETVVINDLRVVLGLILVTCFPAARTVAQETNATPRQPVWGHGDVATSWQRSGGSPTTLLQWNDGSGFSGEAPLGEPLVTDRPSFTESSSTVGRGIAQLEAGYTYSLDDEGAGQTIHHSYPETLLRYGVAADWLELRLGWNYAHEESGTASRSGGEDLSLGLKIAVTPQEGILPAMVILPQMTVPTGAERFSSDEVLPGFAWVYAWDFGDSISTAGSTRLNRSVDAGTGEPFTEWAQSWLIGFALSDRSNSYVEWFGTFPHSADTAEPAYLFNGGLTYLITDNIQWDIRGGTGLNDAAEDYFFGTGLALRFP